MTKLFQFCITPTQTNADITCNVDGEDKSDMNEFSVYSTKL